MKITKFRDIPPFTRSGSYQVNVGWSYLEDQFAQFEKGYGLDLDPDFQRAHVWDRQKQERYVEYILRGGISSRTIYFNCVGWMSIRKNAGPVQLVDGKQRVEAVRAFLRNEIQAFGSYYHEYEDRLHAIGRHDFIFVVNDLKTRAEVLQWYLDLNSGGVVHTEDELEKVRKLLEAENDK